MPSAYDQAALELHAKHHGKIELKVKAPLDTKEDLSKAYTPGVAAVSEALAKDPSLMYEYTPKCNSVAIVSDGSAVLGLGNIGPEGAYPVMEGKAALFKHFGGVDAYPIVLSTQDPEEIIRTVMNISVGFGGINLEDIAAPHCFYIETELKKRLKIPVFHDDQHGTAIVVLAGLMNALKVLGKDKNVQIVLNGAGAAGIAIAKLLLEDGFKNLILVDTSGAIYEGRPEHMNSSKEEIAQLTNAQKHKGGLAEVIVGADIFIGVSQAGVLKTEMLQSMAKEPIVFAMANPVPEIMPEEAIKGGVAIMATGRSDFPNQLNNVLVFPGLLRGALDARISSFNDAIFLRAAKALASMVENPSREKIIPAPFEPGIAERVAEAVRG